jgi:hypothetical protein
MKHEKDQCHEKCIEGIGDYARKERSIQDPPCGANVPDQKCNECKAEDLETSSLNIGLRYLMFYKE